jgi:hypothetical protein
MGQAPSYMEGSLKGGLDDLKAIYSDWREGGYEFGLSRKEFSTLIGRYVATCCEKKLWEAYHVPAPEPGVIFPIELLTGLALSCRGLARDKVAFIFSLFDLSQGGSISYDELGMLIVTVATSVERVRGSHAPDVAPPLSNEKVDMLANKAMSHLHKVIESGTSADEFQDWVENGLKLPIASSGVNLNLLAEALMM